MKKHKVTISLVLFILVFFNIVFFLVLKNIEEKRKIKLLSQQIHILKTNMDNAWFQFENDVNYLNKYKTINALLGGNYGFNDEIELFFSKHKNLIKEINVFDELGHNYFILKDSNNFFVSGYKNIGNKVILEQKERVTQSNDIFYYNIPIFDNYMLYANILITIGIEEFIEREFNKFELYHTGKQVLIDLNGNYIASNKQYEDRKYENLQEILSNLQNGKLEVLKNKIIKENKKQRVISVYSSVNFLKSKFGVIFSISRGTIVNPVLFNVFISTLISIALFIFIVFYFLSQLRSKELHLKFLNEESSNLKSIIDRIPLGILVTDSNNKVSMANDAAVEMLNMENRNEVIGKNISNKLSSSKNITDDITEFNFNANKYVYYDKKGNEIILYKQEVPLELNEEHYNLESFIDITPIERSRKKEVASNNSKSEFLARMSHEIRTPMNGIIGMADSLVNLSESQEMKESVVIIKKSADLLLTIINDILDFSKIEAGKMLLEEIPFNLREEVELTLSLFKPKAKDRDIELILQISDEVPDKIIGDPFRLRQVIANLISNSVKFTHEGEIVLNVEFIKEILGQITLLFTLEDTGIGIPEGNLDLIFGSFNQAEGSISRKYGGTGLGTTIAKQLVELMHGEIWVDSPSSISTNPDYPGTKFGFTIECYSNEKLDKDYNFNYITDFKQIKALVVGEDKEMQEQLLKCFRNVGAHSEFTSFQRNTLKMISGNSMTADEGFKIIFLIDTPTYDAFFIARKLYDKGLSSKYPIVILSSNDKSGNFIKSKRLEVDYYLLKPFEIGDIFTIMKEIFSNLEFVGNEFNDSDRLRDDLSILIAEDNIINQKVAKNIFKKLGYEIDFANNGVEAIEACNSKSYDIIFMDMLMPLKNGIEASIEIRKLNKEVPIIAMTADTSGEDKEKAIESGINDFVYKPAKVETIKSILMKWFSVSVKQTSEA
ncbi:response regulator [Bacteroidota bacterium]